MNLVKTFVTVLVVLFASMVGATQTEAGGFGDLFSGNSPFERVIGAGVTGVAAGAGAAAVCGPETKKNYVVNGLCKGGVGAGISQVVQEVTGNVPISCGNMEPYRDPNTGQLYCSGGSPSVATPPYVPQQQYPQQHPCVYDPRLCSGSAVGPAVYGGNGTTIYTNEVILVGGGRRFRPNQPVYPSWVTPYVHPCAVTPHLCQADPSFQMNKFSGFLDGQDTARHNFMRDRDFFQRMPRGIWQDELRDPAWQQGFQQGLYR